ncbi:MAG: hypothetical protein QOJ12_189 [Thermoleophilales bacterium]|jgi:hypothetical protein|nr:hypothetical protein [Thermoleophilales bacterium]
MLEMFAVYALLLAAWGVYSQRRAASAAEQAETESVDVGPPVPTTITVTRIERGDAARRHLGSTAGV